MAGVITTDKKELPRAFGNPQVAYSELSNLRQKQDRTEVRKGFEKQMDSLIQMYVASLKNQDPFSEKSNTESGVQIAGTTATISSLNQISEQVEDLIDNSKKSQLLNAAGFQGQEVYYDDSAREYKGHNEEFNYELKAPSFLPTNAPIKALIKIVDEKGMVVFSNQDKNAIIGKNRFSWDGRDNNGKEVKRGKYRIEVTASSPSSNGLSSIPIEASSYLSGIVDAIETKDGTVKLLVNGKLIDQDQVKKIATSIDKEASRQLSANQYIGYIGKKVSIDLSRIEVNGGKAEIAINNPINNHGKVKLEIYGENSKYIKTVEYATMPMNSRLELDANKHNIPDGIYTCKVWVEDKDNENKMTLLDGSDQIDVTSIDLTTGQITDGKKKYSVKSIREVTGQSSNETSLINQGGYYIGKQVQFSDDRFVFNGESLPVDLRISKPLAGRKLGPVELRIYKGDELVAHVGKPADELYHQEEEPVPRFDQLNPYGRRQVTRYIRTQFRLPEAHNFGHLNQEMKLLVNNYIEKQLRNGVFFKDGQDYRDETTKLRNMGIVKLNWDGILSSGVRALAGEPYRYEVITSTTANDNSDQRDTKEPITSVGLVRESTVIDGALKLVLSDGKEISPDAIIRVG